MNVSEVRKKYLDFFKSHGHSVVPSATLVPENDPTTLFTGSGMQPLLPYLLGQEHPKGVRIVNSQKCFRAEDIDEVGDNRHTMFFEMLGNWSLGDYFKEEQLPWLFSFLVDEIGLDPQRLYVTVFSGDSSLGIPQDDSSVEIWKKLFQERGIDAPATLIGSEKEGYQKGMGENRIFYYDASKNWWSRAGVPEKMPAGEPGGPDSEIFYDFESEHDVSYGEYCHPNCDCGRFMEIGNSVFMEYIKNEDGSFSQLPQKNVDFGGGLERISAASNGNSDVFSISVLRSLIERIEELSGKKYDDGDYTRSFRIVADHMRGAVFGLSEGVMPNNTDQGYVIRRLLRRSVRYGDRLGVPEDSLKDLVSVIVTDYHDAYPELKREESKITQAVSCEESKFRKTLQQGLRQFEKVSANGEVISGHDAFILFSTYGFPLEMTEELAQERGLTVDVTEYSKKFEEHQSKSRTASAGKFSGGLADHSEKTTMLHTATHLLLAGLRKVLGDHVHQAGSNITQERTRFDFNHPEKVTKEELQKVEDYVNDAISKECSVEIVTMSKQEAMESGVEGSFWEKYPDHVNVYVVSDNEGTVYSRELCGGPHVENTGSIDGTFRISKEESSSAGVRRIKAVLE